jgi:hypothetical protein
MKQVLSFIGLVGFGLIIFSVLCYVVERLMDKLFKA